MEKQYDIAIVGTGPAGLEAAITCKVRNKEILLIGNNLLSEKVAKAHSFENYLGLPNITGQELNQKFNEHIKSMGIQITEGKVTNIYSMGKYFNIQVENKFYKATAVILASGANFGKPYNGEEEFLGRGVSYCATCDGNLYKEKTVAVIASSANEEKEANYLATLASKVYYIPLYKNIENLSSSIEIIKETPTQILGNLKVTALKTKLNTYSVDGVFILRDAISPKNLVPGLKMDENNVSVTRLMQTNLKGLFACGDIVGRPYQAIKSAGEGNIAALSAVEYIDSLGKEDE